jgi:hypothetical protein
VAKLRGAFFATFSCKGVRKERNQTRNEERREGREMAGEMRQKGQKEQCNNDISKMERPTSSK